MYLTILNPERCDHMIEIKTVKEYEQALLFQSPIPVSWAVQQYADLINKIESQKETIDDQYMTISTANMWNSKLKDELESLKAITELAVKGLEWYAGEQYGYVQFFPPIPDIPILHDCGGQAKTVLAEIRRLSHETP